MNMGGQEIHAAATSYAIYVPGGILADGTTTASFEMYDVSGLDNEVGYVCLR